MRQTVLRELAVQTLQYRRSAGTVDADLLEAARREGVTITDLLRERLLVRSGVAPAGGVERVRDQRAPIAA